MLRVISYNLCKHRAAPELEGLVENNDVNVLCLQELDTSAAPKRIGRLKLADATSQNRLGLAIYYDPSTFIAGDSRSMMLKKSLHDMVLNPAHERFLSVPLYDIDNRRQLVVASFHAAPLTARNALRRKQIAAALATLRAQAGGVGALMVGDFNYPVFKERLGDELREQGFELNLSDQRTYLRYRFFRGHYDFAASVALPIERVVTLEQGLSDHLPILVSARLSDQSPRL